MMVRVKRSTTTSNNRSFMQNLSVKFHFYIIIQTLSIVACVGFYLILQSQEVRTMLCVKERVYV